MESLEAELRRERQAHAATSNLLDLIVGQLPAFFWVLDRDLRVLRNGGAIDQLMGFSAASLVGRTLYDIMAQYPGRTNAAIEMHERALAGERVQLENEYRDKLVATIVGEGPKPSICVKLPLFGSNARFGLASGSAAVELMEYTPGADGVNE